MKNNSNVGRSSAISLGMSDVTYVCLVDIVKSEKLLEQIGVDTAENEPLEVHDYK